MASSEESQVTIDFRKWLEDNDAYIHPGIYFGTGQFGSSVFTKVPLASDTKLVACPLPLIITPKLARNALETLSSSSCPLDDREAICTYLSLHLAIEEYSSEDRAAISIILKHQPYIKSLPNELWTPLFWSEEEMKLLVGTNLHGAVLDRKQAWLESWRRSLSWVKGIRYEWNLAFTWERFLRAQTWLSSRAFPSSLLNDPPSLSSHNASPVLIPLVDALNHARATPISWSLDQSSGVNKGPSLSLISHKENNPGEELYNNYGAKPNDELILGYGFVLANNPEDTLLLKLPGKERRYKIGVRSTGQVEAVWNEIGRRLQESFPSDVDNLEAAVVELEMEIGQLLPEMIASLRDRLPNMAALADSSLPGVRPEVRRMIEIYVQGQREILDDLLAFAERRLRAAIEKAQELGIDVTLESDEDEYEEEV